MRTVGTANRSEIELDPVKAYRRGLVLDSMLAAAAPIRVRGVMRGTHAYFNRVDADRQLQAARNRMETAMNEPIVAPKVPMSFRAVAVIGLLWNCIGVYFYLLARLDPDAVMGSAPQEMRDYVAHMPLWANIGYGFGIWGSFAGSVLMLLRSPHATTAFLVSFVGAATSFTGQAVAGVLRPAEPAVILAVIAFLWWFSRRAQGQAILK